MQLEPNRNLHFTVDWPKSFIEPEHEGPESPVLITKLQAELEGWEVVNEHHLRKEYKFKDFKETQTFVNRVADLAEEQWHHPDICFGWGRAEVTIWTHKIDGLTESDFILAAKIDML